MQCHGHRGYWNTDHKPDGVTRVLCLGDSLTFGQGVLAHQAYPAVLEEHLNRFCWNRAVEVVNGGVCGYSMHDCFLDYRQRGMLLAPDVAVLTLCDNDAEFHTAQKVDYRSHSDSNWDPQGPVYPLFLQALAAFKAYTDEQNVPLVLCFISLGGDNEEQRRIAEQLNRAAADLALDFLDLSADFTGPQSVRNNPKAAVSKADGHPSISSHRTIAMRLARHLLTSGPLRGAGAPPIPEDKVMTLCEDAAREFHRAGRPAESACSWLRETLAAKRQCRARVRLDDADLIPDKAFTARLASLETELAGICLHRQLQGFAALLNEANHQSMNGCQRALERMNKHCTLLEAASPNTPLLHETLETILAGGINRGQQALGLEEILNAAQELRTLEAHCRDRLAACGTAQDVPGIFLPALLHDNAAQRKIQRCLHEFGALTQGLQEIALRFKRLYSRGVNGHGQDYLRGMSLLQVHLGGIAEMLQGIADSAHFGRLPNAASPGGKLPMTTLAVRMTVHADQGASVRMTAYASEPFLPPVSDVHHGVSDGIPHVYHYAFPLLVNGSVCIDLLHTKSDLALADILGPIEVNPGQAGNMTLAPEDLEMETATRAWLHLALVRP